MNYKLIILTLITIFGLATNSPVLGAAEPIPQEQAVLTPAQAEGAALIANAITFNDAPRVDALYKKFFAADLTISRGQNSANRQALAQSLLDAVNANLEALYKDTPIKPYKNAASIRFHNNAFNFLEPRQPTLDKMEQLGPDLIEHVFGYLPSRDVIHFTQTAKHAQRLANTTLDKRNLYYHWTTAELIGRRNSQEHHQGQVNIVRFSHNGKILASGSDDQKIILWDAETMDKIIELTGHTGAITALDFSPDDSTIVSAGTDGTIRIWVTATGQESLRLEGIDDSFNYAVFSHDGKSLAWTSFAAGKPICMVRNLATQRQKYAIFDKELCFFAFSPNDTKLLAVTSGWTYKIMRWNLTDNTIITVNDLYTPNYVWNRLNRLHRAHCEGPYAIAFSDDFKHCIAAFGDKIAITMSPKNSNFLNMPTGGIPEGRICSMCDDKRYKGLQTYAMAYAPNQQHAVFFMGNNKLIMLGNETYLNMTLNIIGTAISFAANGKKIAIGANDGTVAVVQPVTYLNANT